MTSDIPTLDEVVLRALELHGSYELPRLDLGTARKRLVIASGNALPTGRILFWGEKALFCDEGQYRAVLDAEKDVDSVVVISASGTKHAPLIVRDVLARGLTPYLITCVPDSPAAQALPKDHVVATRSVPEPITYNTSTYMGMILASTREDPKAIRQHLLDVVSPLLADFRPYGAFYLIVPSRFEVEIPMFITKFDELFGGRVAGRCYTLSQTLHAKTVVPWEKELFISFGEPNELFGTARLHVPLMAGAGFAAMVAAGYYVIGRIQAQLPPWFKENAETYRATQQELFRKLESAGK